MSVVTIEGEFVHYEVLGRGRPVFFLHGWIGSWRYWVPAMQAASMGYRAYAIDLWGFGDTTKRPPMYSLEKQVKLLDDFLEALGIGKIAIIGHGLGAVVALAYAAGHESIVDRVMLASLPIGPNTVNPRLRTSPVPELADWLLGRLPATEAARLDAPKADHQAIFTSLADLDAINTLEMAQALTTSCLLVHGQNDPAIQTPALEIVDGLPQQTHTIVFDQAGHFPMLDDPNKFNRLLGDFLSLSPGESPRQLQLKEEWKRRVR